jgi:hypothetical protein
MSFGVDKSQNTSCAIILTTMRSDMQSRYWLFRRRNGVFYYEDTQTGKHESLATRDRREAKRLTVYLDITVTCGQVYFYRVSAFRGPVGSAYSNTTSTDTDEDGIPDCWMLQYFGHPTGQSNTLWCATCDADGDGLSNLQEYFAGTHPLMADTDGDGMPDDWEIAHGLNPLTNDASADPDGDGQNGLQEYLAGTDPTNSVSVLRITAVEQIGPDISRQVAFLMPRQASFVAPLLQTDYPEKAQPTRRFIRLRTRMV